MSADEIHTTDAYRAGAEACAADIYDAPPLLVGAERIAWCQGWNAKFMEMKRGAENAR